MKASDEGGGDKHADIGTFAFNDLVPCVCVCVSTINIVAALRHNPLLVMEVWPSVLEWMMI